MLDDNGHGLSLRELVLEIREDVRALRLEVQRIDRQGSIGTREELTDHENRVRGLERWKYALSVNGLAAVGASIAALIHGYK